jgi:hypothetical protein
LTGAATGGIGEGVMLSAHRVLDCTDGGASIAGPGGLACALRSRRCRLEHPICGRVPLEGSRMRLSATPGQVTHPGPTLGQHNDHVLRDLLGLHDDEIEQLVVAGAIE